MGIKLPPDAQRRSATAKAGDAAQAAVMLPYAAWTALDKLLPAKLQASSGMQVHAMRRLCCSMCAYLSMTQSDSNHYIEWNVGIRPPQICAHDHALDGSELANLTLLCASTAVRDTFR